MNRAYCYSPQAIDKKLANYMSTRPYAIAWTPGFIATLRGAYDLANGFSEEQGKVNPMWSLDIDTEDYDGDSVQADNLYNIAQTLADFRFEKKKEQANAINNFNENRTEIWTTISDNYSDLNTFYQRASQLSFYFIQAVDNYIEQQRLEGKIFTRKQIIEGIPLEDEDGHYVMSNGKPMMAIDSDKIFSAVFNRFMEDYSERMDDPNTKEAAKKEYYHNEYQKIFNPKVWAALLMASKAQLKQMEGLKVSLTDNSASEVDLSTLNDNDLSDLFIAEESVREGWQVITDCLSAYGNLSKEVRKALSYIPLLDEKGQALEDDLGYDIRMSSITAYHDLMDLLRNCRSKSKMMKLIERSQGFRSLYDKLVNNEVLQSQLYNNFRKTSQLYVQIQWEWNKIKFYVLNKTKGEHSVGNYLFSIKYRPAGSSIAASSRTHWSQADLDSLSNLLKQFEDKYDSDGKLTYSFWKERATQQATLLRKVFNALGIAYTDKALSTLLDNKKNLSEVVKQLAGLSQHGGLKSERADTEGYNFYAWLTYKTKEQEKGDTQAKIEKIITKLEESGNGIVYENKCRTVNGKGQSVTYYGDVQPNFMGDLLGKIQSFAQAFPEEREESRKEFKEWLRNKYFSSSQFCTDFDAEGNPKSSSNVKNFLLRTLWEEANADVTNARIEATNKQRKLDNEAPLPYVTDMFDDNSLTSQFRFMRVVTGKYQQTVIPFENFTTKQHFEQLVGSYFALDTQSNQQMQEFVYVPVFVLGDSGVCKVLKIKRKSTFDDYQDDKFNGDSVVEELYNLYESELRRMTLFQKFIEQNNKKHIKNNPNILKTSKKFTMLTFLNEEFKGRDFKTLGKQEVKQAINKYLEKGFAAFLKVGENTGALKVDSSGKLGKNPMYQDICRIADPRKEAHSKTPALRERLKELYYNVYLSNLLQYQIFTGDLGYYESVKEFQKRYKEVHAPGEVLDVNATWKGKEVVKANAQGLKTQKTIYFEDIGVSVEENNKELAEVLLKLHSSDRAAAEKAIAEGILEPKKGIEEDERQKRLKELLGSNYNVYLKFITTPKSEVTRGSSGSSQTDGQGFRHIDSYRKIEIMRGTWSSNPLKEVLYQEVSTINEDCIKNHRNPTPEELDRIQAFHVTIMPLKPYLFTMEKVHINDGKTDDNLFVPVQHKYAEAILIPCLLPVGSKLREVAEYMGENNIDLICSDSVVKVGMWGQTDIEEKSSTDISSFVNEAKKNISKLPSSVKTDSSPLRIMSIEKGLDFNISVGETYNVKLDDKNAQYHILGYEQDGDQHLSKIWFTSSEAPNKVSSLVGSTLAEFIDAAGSHNPIKANTNSTINIKDNLSKAVIHELNYEDYRIQSNVPEHINVERALGTQIRKLIMGNINMFSKDVYGYLKDKNGEDISFRLTKGGSKMKLTGRNLVSLYTSLIVANMMQSFAKFKRNIENEKKLSTLLTSAIVNNDRYSLHQLLDIAVNDGEFATPLYEGSIEHDTISMIASIFRKEVNKQDMNGGSAVQVSDWGITAKEEVTGTERPLKFVTDVNNENVLYAEIEIPFNFTYINSDGIEVALDFNTYCNPDGTFKLTGNTIDIKGVKVAETKIEHDFPGILDIIAYRIPSERCYSMLNCRVVRCSNMTAGGTIRVPAQGTTIAGFDFDIDKLYLLRRSFVKRRVAVESAYSGAEKYDIFAKIYAMDAERQRVLEAKDKSQKANIINAQAEKTLREMNQDPDDYASVESLWEELFINLESPYTTVYEELSNEDKDYLENKLIIPGERLKNVIFLSNLFNEEKRRKVSEISDDKIYKGSEVFHMLFDELNNGQISKKGWKIYNKLDYSQEYYDEEQVREDEDYIPSSAIISKLRAIREASGEYHYEKTAKGKVKKVYDKALAEYWNTMIEQNPYMEGEDAYDKGKLFEQAAKELGLWKEIEYKEELENYDFDKGVTQNSRSSRNNLIFELMRQRLMDPETLRDRLTPGGFDNSRNAAAYLKKLLHINEEQDAADPSTLLFYNQLNQVAAKLIGVFANQSTNHQLSSIIRSLDLREPILFDGMIDAKLIKSTEALEGLEDTEKEEKIGRSLLSKIIQLKDGTIVDIDLNLAEFLAASVDAVKDPVLNYLNFNTTTASVGALLARMGYATKDIGLLFNQPIIKEVCDIIQNSGNTLSFNSVKSDIIKKYGTYDEYKKIATDVTSETLEDTITRYIDVSEKAPNAQEAFQSLKQEKDYMQTQLAALKIFDQAFKASRELNNFINTTKFTAANAVGSTLGFFYNQQYKVEDYVNQSDNMLKMVIYESLKNAQEIQEGSKEVQDKSLNTKIPSSLVNDREAYIKSQIENPFAFEQCMYDLNKEFLKILSKYYPYDKAIYKNRREVLRDFLAYTRVLDAETIDYAHRETMQHILSSTDSAFNPTAIYVNEAGEEILIDTDKKDLDGNPIKRPLTNREYYLYQFPIELFNMEGVPRIDALKEKYLKFTYSTHTDTTTGKVNAQLNISVDLAVEQTDKNTFTNLWAQLASQHSDPLHINQIKVDFIKKYIKLHYLIPMDITLKNLERAKGERYEALNKKYEDYEEKLKDFLKDILSSEQLEETLTFANAETFINVYNVDRINLPAEEQEALNKEIQKKINMDNICNKVALGLYFHNYYRTGFGTGPFSFTQFTPIEVKNLIEIGEGADRMPYLDYIRPDNLETLATAAIKGRYPRSAVEFAYMYALNHTDDYKLVTPMPSTGNQTYASYFVDAYGYATSKFSIDIHTAEKDIKEADKKFVMAVDKETGDFKVHPVIRRGGQIYVATIDGEYNFTGNIFDSSRHIVTYMNVPILGKKNVSTTYASTLDEALAIKKGDAEVLTAIEQSISDTIKEDIIRRQLEEKGEEVDVDDLLHQSEEVPSETVEENPIGANFAEDDSYTEEDVDALMERISECNQVNEDFLLEYVLKTYDETAPEDQEVVREKAVPAIKEKLNKAVEEGLPASMQNTKVAEAYKKQLLIEQLANRLKADVKAGRIEVYTKLTKEKIC